MNGLGSVAVTHHDDNGTWLVALTGEHDLSTAPELERQTTPIWASCSVAVIDLSAASFIDSSVTRWLLTVERRRKGGNFTLSVVVGLADSVAARALGLMGVRDTLPCYPSLEAALDRGPAKVATAARESQNVRILLADERRGRLDELTRSLNRLGYGVISRQAGLEVAAALTQEQPFDVVIVAVGERARQSLDLVGRLVREAQCPVIALLDSEDAAFMRRAARRGVFACLSTLGDADGEQLESAIQIALHRFADDRALEGAFARRDVIERAKGVLMERHSIDEQAAFALLRDRSRRANRKLVDLAQAVLGTRALLAGEVSRRSRAADEEDRRLVMLERAEEIAGIGGYDWDIGTGELRWSDGLFRLFGLEPGALQPDPEYVLERTHPEDRDRVRRAVEAAARTGELESLEYRIIQADGSVRRLHAVVASGQQEAGGAGRIVGTVQDVTERRQIAREVAAHLAMEDVLATWVSLEADGERLLMSIGEANAYSFGRLWVQRDDVLVARSLWASDVEDASAQGAERLSITPGLQPPLPVEAWLTRRPVVVVDLALASPFCGRDAAVDAGQRGALAFPAVNDEASLAVLEFSARDALQPTETFVRSLTGMGRELGHFLARRTGELRPHGLTAREREMLQLTAQGKSGKEIAQQLSLSPSTVKTHFENIYRKWGVSDRASAVAKALREGLIR